MASLLNSSLTNGMSRSLWSDWFVTKQEWLTSFPSVLGWMRWINNTSSDFYTLRTCWFIDDFVEGKFVFCWQRGLSSQQPVVEIRDPAIAFASLCTFAMFVVDPDVVEINNKQKTYHMNEYAWNIFMYLLQKKCKFSQVAFVHLRNIKIRPCELCYYMYESGISSSHPFKH
jgi:hypothetical protein